MSVRRSVDQAVASWSPAVAAHHVGAGAGLIEEHERRWVHVASPDLPKAAMLSNVRSILLGGAQRFFCVSGRACATSTKSSSAIPTRCRAPAVRP